MSKFDISNFCIPLPLQIVIDDVGWWSGSDDSENNGPFRTGIKRNHVPADYAALAELGRHLNIRPQAAMVLCEWDKEDILRKLPSSTWLRENWRNPHQNFGQCEEAAQILRDNRAWLEFTLHGVGHEFWHEDGSFSRAEWYDEDGNMRDYDEVMRHLDAYHQIMEQHDLGDFPESFVPCAFKYAFGDGQRGLAAILARNGIKYISTPYGCLFKKQEPQQNYFGVDEGIVTIDRGKSEIVWNQINSSPDGCNFDDAICGLHWPNLLANEPENNSSTILKWVDALKKVNKRFERKLSRNSAAHRAQLIYHELTEAKYDDGKLTFDFSRYFSRFYKHQPEGFTMRIRNTDIVECNGEVHGTDPSSDYIEIKIYPQLRQLTHSIDIRKRL
jgi:hypothetical protein